jgi:hypothetical protein
MANIGDRPSNDQPLSHWDGCYKNMQHHECAVERVAQLEQLLRDVRPWMGEAPYALADRIDAVLTAETK